MSAAAVVATVNYDLCATILRIYILFRSRARIQSLFIFFSVSHRNRNGPTTNCAGLFRPRHSNLLPIHYAAVVDLFAHSGPSTKHFNKQPHTRRHAAAHAPSGPDLFSPSCTSSLSYVFFFFISTSSLFGCCPHNKFSRSRHTARNRLFISPTPFQRTLYITCTLVHEKTSV